jgi:hypothetical protein
MAWARANLGTPPVPPRTRVRAWLRAAGLDTATIGQILNVLETKLADRDARDAERAALTVAIGEGRPARRKLEKSLHRLAKRG